MTALKRKTVRNLHWVFFCLAVVLTAYMDVYVANSFLDGDASQPFVRGWLIAQQRNLFTDDVYFTTEVRFLDTSAIAAVFFLLFSDWTLVRILTMLTQQAWYVISFLFLCRQAGVRFPQALTAAGILLLPVSVPYARVVIYHMYYLLYIANMFWIMGLTIRLLSGKGGRQRRWTWALLAASWLLAGLEGIRYMMILGIPLLAFAACAVFAELQRREWCDGRLTGGTPIRHTDAARLLRVMCVSCLFFLAGYAIHAAVLLPAYGVTDSGKAWFMPNAEPQRYADIFHGWLVASGIRSSKENLIGVRGLSLAASLMLFGYLIFSSARKLPGGREYGSQPMARQMMGGLFAAALVTTTLIFVFESGQRYYELYYIPVVALAFPALAHELSALEDRGVSAARKLMVLLSCLCVLFQSAYSLYYIRLDKGKLDKWGGLAYTETDTVDQLRDCVAFMQENGYTHGFVNYWYANAMIEMSDGELMVAGMDPYYSETPSLSMVRWGTVKSAFAPENMPEKVIVFILRTWCQPFEAAFPDAPLVHEGWTFNGYEVSADQIK